MQTLESLFTQYTQENCLTLAALTPAGSNRRYFRLRGKTRSLIGVEGTSAAENRAFIALSDHFAKQGLPVPSVVAHSDDYRLYLQDDLGDCSLFDTIADGRASGNFSKEELQLLKTTIAQLPMFQFCGAKGLDFSLCYPQPSFDARNIAFDQNYFKYCFLKPSCIEFDEIALDDDFRCMSDRLLKEQTNTFMYRDFQARNVMIRNGKPYFIDFQGGRRGPIYYDVASFVWQAKAAYPDAVREMLIATYLEALKPYTDIDEGNFREQLRHFVLFRTLQVLGTYGFRGCVERKPHFLQSIPFAIESLRTQLRQVFDDYPYLTQVLHELIAHWQREPAKPEKAVSDKRLTVRIFSFSYKNGIPADSSGNGGGYVFDCRAMHNPGRYERYRSLTGMDREVVDFLETEGEVFAFLENVYRLVDFHAEVFIRRGFTDLMVSFGCTGGQHRSVYCAERLAEHLKAKFDVDIIVEHREQKVIKQL